MENRDAGIALAGLDVVESIEGVDARLETVDVGGARLACIVAGADDAPLVLLAHGFPDCARTFRLQFPALVKAGYRVVAPWMRGYFPSTIARDQRYDAAALGNDLVGLARHFSPRKPARLVGHDWGAIAAFAACALAPRAFSHLVTVAVPHLRVAARHFFSPAQLRRSWYIALFQLPLAERLVSRDHFALIDRLWRDWSPGFAAPPEELAHVKRALERKENLAAALAYYRAMRRAFIVASTRRLLLSRTRVPAVHVHGIDDGCIGIELCEGLERGYAAPVTLARLAGGHFVHQENAERFNALVLDWFARPHP